MHNVFLILKREYLTRVKKKSFIVMTLLGPLLIGLFYAAIIWISVSDMGKDKRQIVAVSDKSGMFTDKLDSLSMVDFLYTDESYDSLKADLEKGDIDGILLIPEMKNGNTENVQYITKKSASLTERSAIDQTITNRLFEVRLNERGLNKKMIDSLKTNVSVINPILNKDKLEEGGAEVKSGVGFLSSIIIYMFILIFGVQVMRGVTEEKSNRIVEILVSSVKPFQLMLGKIFGIALVGLTQFIIWILLSSTIIAIATSFMGGEAMAAQHVADAGSHTSNTINILGQFSALPLTKIIIGFLFYFTGGFLLYSSLFAAIGSAVDNDTETQQFMLPVTIPLVFALMIASNAVFKDPNGSIAVWSSMIPFTSPIVMMVRIPFDVSWGEILLSMFILSVTFVIIVWLASKIYRIGILMYGKKANYKELLKWMMSKS
ncbi:MAG: ABC transporter permease [Bacteroidia bacterium]|nr:ABC transporter permease [Bacteroidia bacterium]